jgi:glycosyltransferase involved in cell wall biosynthesis/peptidoglycan/xylan/chitin deacetylase (PgdA/CDA1 family)
VVETVEREKVSEPFRSLVLCYHAVSATWSHVLAVDPKVFERQIRVLLARGYQPAPMAEIVKGDRKLLHVTFDDGYRSALNGLLILKRLRVPATMFVCPAYADDGGVVDARYLGGEAEAYANELRSLTWDALRHIDASEVEIGSHSLTHAHLTELSDGELHRELSESRTRIEDELGRRCRYLSYPHGEEDARVRAAARRAGYAAAFTTAVRDHTVNPFVVPRVAIYRHDGRIRFAVKTSPRLAAHIRPFAAAPRDTLRAGAGGQTGTVAHGGERDVVRRSRARHDADRRTLKTLIVTSETPLPPNSGGRARTLNLARQLARGFDVELAALGAAETTNGEAFPIRHLPHHTSRGRALATSWRRPYLAALLSSPDLGEFVSSGGWDTVQAETPWTVLAAARAGVPVVLDAYDVETDVLRSLVKSESSRVHRTRWRWEARKTERYERAALRWVDGVCAASEHDAEMFRRWGAARCVVVPNGVDTAAVPFHLPPPEPRVLYVGYFPYRPNTEAARELVREIFPRVRANVPSASVYLVGRGSERLGRLERSGVSVVGEVEDLVAELHRARVLVLPLRAGSGTRLKVVEAMAAGLPIVSTRFGVAGLEVRDGEHVLLGESAEELAAQAVRVLRDDELAFQLSRAGRALVERRYDWSILAQPLVELHADLARRP